MPKIRRFILTFLSTCALLGPLAGSELALAQAVDARQAAQIAQRTYQGKVLNVKTDSNGGYTVKILQSDGRIRLVKVSKSGKVKS